MKIEDFLARLDGVQAGADATRWTARCPAHDDAQASLGVHVTADNKILLKCYAGCAASDVVAAMGLKMKDLFADPREGGAGAAVKKGSKRGAAAGAAKANAEPAADKYKKRRPSRKVCAYDYTDEGGTILYRVERREYTDAAGGKTFTQLHPTAGGGWGYGVTRAGVTRVPFNLPKVVAAAKAGKTIVICEGEKDVVNFETLTHVAATCNAGGAGKWEAGWGRYFVGAARVLIIADNDPIYKVDEKTGEARLFAPGQRHANKVELLLRADGFEGEIKKIVMPEVAGEKCKDFSDWMDARRRNNLSIERADVLDMVAGVAAWPEDWRWDEDVAEGADAIIVKDARAASRMSPGAVDATAARDAWLKDMSGVAGGVGRFGRLAVRAPISDERCFEVDFRLSPDKVARLMVSTGHYGFKGFIKSADGEWSLQDYVGPMPCALSAMMPITYGFCARFLGDKFPTRLMSEIQSALCLAWLRARGKFFWDDTQRSFASSLYFDEARGILMKIRSDEFCAFIATEAEINRESSGFRYMMSLVDDAAMTAGVSQGVVPSSMWDRREDRIYISNGDDRMYRLSGGRVEDVQNGTDGVVFVRGKTLEPWVYDAAAAVDPFDKALIFSGASWADKTGPMNVRLWVLNLFACHATKPILLITGAMQSGKTRMAKAIKEILGVRMNGKLDFSTQSVEDGDKGLDAFWATVNEGKLEVFDNLDTKIKWVSDALQNAATDGQVKRRTLYTTSGVSLLKANASIIITSNNPIFSTEGGGGMSDRIISANLLTNRSVALDTELSDDIRKNRNAYLSWITRTVACALADDSPVDNTVNRRHPDYGRFSVRCGRQIGREDDVLASLCAAEVNKALLPILNDAIAKEIYEVLRAFDFKLKFTSGEMADLIIAGFGDDADEKTKQIFGSRRIGRTMVRYMRQFEVIINILGPRILEGRTVYETFGLTSAGALSAAGKVDFEGCISESSRIGEGTGGFSENASKNPPYPPTRADVPLSSSLTREEKNKNEMEVIDDLVF